MKETSKHDREDYRMGYSRVINTLMDMRMINTRQQSYRACQSVPLLPAYHSSAGGHALRKSFAHKGGRSVTRKAYHTGRDISPPRLFPFSGIYRGIPTHSGGSILLLEKKRQAESSDVRRNIVDTFIMGGVSPRHAPR